MSIGSKLISNTTYLFLDWLLSALLSFIFWLVVWKLLEPVDWGIIGTITNLIILFSSLLVLGLPVTLSKLIPHYVNRKKERDAYPMISYSLKIISLSLLIYGIVSVLFAGTISSFLKIPIDAFILTSASVILLSFGNLFGYVQQGFQQMKKYFISDSMNFAVKMIGTAILIFTGFKYLGPILAMFLGYLSAFIMRFNPKYIFSKSKSAIDKKEIFRYAVPAYITGAAWSIIIYSQYILLTVLGGSLEVTGVFTVPFTLSNLLGVFATVLTTAAFPVVSGLCVSRNAQVKQSRIISFVFRYTMFVTIPLGILLLIFPQYAILLISKPESLSGSVYFPLLVPAALMYGLGYIFHTSLYAIGKPQLQRNIVLLTTTIFFTLSLLLTGQFSGMGLAIAYFASMAFLFITSLFYIRKCLKFQSMDAVKILAASAGIGILMFLVKSIIGNIFILALALVPALFIYLGLLYVLGFYRNEDISILKAVGGRIPFLKKYVHLVERILERLVKKQ